MNTDDLNKQAADRITHPAAWNSWYLYIQARRNDTLNAEEKGILNELWSMTTTMNKMVENAITARRKSIPKP